MEGACRDTDPQSEGRPGIGADKVTALAARIDWVNELSFARILDKSCMCQSRSVKLRPSSSWGTAAPPRLSGTCILVRISSWFGLLALLVNHVK